MATITLDPNTDFQTMTGWEGVANTGLNENPASGPNYHDEALDAFVDLGGNRIRTEIQSGMTENTTDYYGLFQAHGVDVVDNTNPTEWANVRANRYVPVNDNGDANSINASGFQWSQLEFQIDNYVLPLKQKLAARGETLYWSLCYIHFSASNQLHVDTPAEYGEFVLACWDHINSAYGAQHLPDGLEIFLEPDNTPAVTAAELAPMIVAARDRLVNAGYAKPDIIAPSTTQGGNGRGYYLTIKSTDATAAGYIDEISYHHYVALDDAGRAQLWTTASGDGKKTAMLEYTNTASTYLLLHADLKTAHVSAWQQFTISYPGSDTGGKYFVVGSGPSYTLTEGNRTKYIRHYFYAVRMGAVMHATSASGTGSGNVDALFFENPNGRQVVVIKCTASVSFDIAGLSDNTYKVVYTTGDGTNAPSAYWQSLSDQVVSGGGNTGTISMPGAGVVTVYAEDYLYLPPPPRWFKIAIS